MTETGDRRSGIGRPRRRGTRAGPLAGALLLLGSPIADVRSQAPGSYLEHAVITVAAGTGGDGTQRTIVRDARYDVSRRGDSLVVQATELALRSSRDGETVRHDTDGFVGGRWKLLAAADGTWRVVEFPFVPAALEEVIDLAAVMLEFFPPPPPGDLAVGATADGPDGRAWQRLPGDGRHAVHAWTVRREVDSTRALADEMQAVVHERFAERGEGSWSAAGVVAWTRAVTVDSETVVADRVIRARLRQEVEVRRAP